MNYSSVAANQEEDAQAANVSKLLGYTVLTSALANMKFNDQVYHLFDIHLIYIYI